MLAQRLRIAAERLADWLDDRWTWAAIGLLTGYFGFESPDTLEWQAWQEVGIAVASLVLILIRDEKRRSLAPPPEPGWNDASKIPPIEFTGKSESGPASSAEHPDLYNSVVDHRGSDVVADSVQRLPSNRQSNTTEAIDRNPHGFGDRD